MIGTYLRILTLATLCLSVAYLPSNAGIVTSLDDVEFWVGSGANRTALVLDWDGEISTDESLVWGYRWDGAASGEDMFRDILAADARLFTKISASGPTGIAVYGLGYDKNDDCEFAIDDGTIFGMDGIYVSSPTDLGTSVDPNDLYTEGWYLGFWHVGTAATNPYDGGSWVNSFLGIGSVNLANNAWTSLAYTTDTFSTTAFAENPYSAEAPGLAADFDTDDDVDGADFLAWQSGFGILSGATRSQGDADCNGLIDEIDQQIWEQSFGLASASSGLRSAALVVPELSTSAYALMAIVYFFFTSRLTLRRVV